MHKGQAVRAFVAEQEAAGIVFGGDDLGDIEAFEAVRALRAEGLPGLVVCSASDEQPASSSSPTSSSTVPPASSSCSARLRPAALTSNLAHPHGGLVCTS